jgi:hypothetical protein
MARGELVGYDKRVTTTWALAFTEVGQSGPACGLLRWRPVAWPRTFPAPAAVAPASAPARRGRRREVAPLLALHAAPLAAASTYDRS